MRITFINRYFWPDHSATSQLLSDLAAELGVRGATVSVITSRQRYDDPDARLPELERWRGIQIRRLWTSRFGRSNLLGRSFDYLTFYASLLVALLGSVRRGDLVVAMTDPPLLSFVVGPAAWLRGGIRVNWLQDLFPEVAVALGRPRIPAFLAGALKWLRNWSLANAGANVAIGERMSEYLRDQGLDSARLATIPNWPHEDAIRPMLASESNLRQRLGLLAHFVVGYSGNLGRAHDWRTILVAAQHLASRPDIVFLIGGGGHGYDALRERVEAEALPNVLFQPYHPLETLSDSMAAADLHLVSLRPELEGLIVPSKFYGIAAAERAVGFTGDPDGELGRLIAESGCGFTVAPERGDSLAEAIAALAMDRALCREQGKCARRLLVARSSRHEAHRRWHDLLMDCSRTRKNDMEARGNRV